MNHTICYISKQARQLTEGEIDSLFQFILDFNSKNQISGILLFNQGIFLQVLEGDSSVLKRLFKNIRNDTRHRNILTVLEQRIEERIFAEYKAGFSILKSKTDLQNLNGYLSLNGKGRKYPENVQNLLQPFMI